MGMIYTMKADMGMICKLMGNDIRTVKQANIGNDMPLIRGIISGPIL